MRVLIVLRSDASLKGGGDVIQARAYADELAACGIDVTVERFCVALNVNGFDIVHVFNVSRPFELLEVMHRLGRQHCCISPICQSRRQLRRLRRSRGSGALSMAAGLIPEAIRQYMLFIRRTMKDMGASFAAKIKVIARATCALPRVARRVARVLEQSGKVFVLANSEVAELTRQYRWSRHNLAMVPNGVPARLVARARGTDVNASRNAHIVCVGRIEPGKAQLALARAAVDRGVEVVFVGAASDHFRTYVSRFRRMVEQHTELLSWKGSLQQDDVFSILLDSRVAVNVSWLEVQSLVDIEAACARCMVVTVPNGGSSSALLGARVVELPERDIGAAVELAYNLSLEPFTVRADVFTRTWGEVAAEIAGHYRTLTTPRFDTD